MSNYFPPRTTPGSQPSIKSAMASKEMQDAANMTIARWWFDAIIPFNGARDMIKRTGKNALDPISLENIDILADWIAEEPTLMTIDEFEGWAIVEVGSAEKDIPGFDGGEQVTAAVVGEEMMMITMIFESLWGLLIFCYNWGFRESFLKL
ncbi:hypothetical protein MRB53_002424 [Persea americana]|uniref:Uncharacterized protein n=1 Tax=Persea americana TaxID=3435 RepID=A0ACC2MVC7_PERAE|nr:hypothetical protein MRB53_002424 [Persea americana]